MIRGSSLDGTSGTVVRSLSPRFQPAAGEKNLRSESCGNFDWKSMKIDDFKPLWLRKWRTQTNINQLEWDLSSDLWSKKLDVETFLCQSRKKISFSKINLLNLGKNLVGPWGSTQLVERSPKPVSHPKSDTRKVSRPSSPQNRPTCTCSTLPRASARTPPLHSTRAQRHGGRRNLETTYSLVLWLLYY